MSETIERICSLSDAFGACGMEDEVIALASRDVRSICRIEEDSMRNLYLYLSEENKPLLLLDAHADEISFIVQAVRDDGMLLFLPLGGSQPAVFAGSSVTILTRSGKKISAIVSSVPPHFSRNPSGRLEYEDLLIDPGCCSRQEVMDLGIAPGDFVVPNVKCVYDKERDLFIGKAFDCRIGAAALLETLHRLKGKKLSVDIAGTLSSQEEVGERGMIAVADKLHPAAAICFEGCPADDTFQPEYLIQSGLKRGPMLRHFDRSMITNVRFMNFVKALAEEKKIPVQFAVRKGGGTNGGILHTRNIPTVVIGIPVRYAHAPCGYCARADFAAAVDLAEAIALHLDKELIASF